MERAYMAPPLVSITIPTFNSANTLRACLKAIAASTYPNFEVIVVDGGSHDNSVRIAEELGAKVLTIKHGLLGARYAGVKEARRHSIRILWRGGSSDLRCRGQTRGVYSHLN